MKTFLKRNLRVCVYRFGVTRRLYYAIFLVRLVVSSLASYILSYFKRPLKDTDGNRAIITILPGHDNLGDHAIGYAEREFVQNYFPGHEIVELTMRETYKCAIPLRRSMKENDLLFMTGGGNMGSLYVPEEITRWFVCWVFRKFTRIQFPISTNYRDDLGGKIVLSIAKRVYSKHKDRLVLVARDPVSYQFMKTHFKNSATCLCPDTVLFLSYHRDVKRHRIGICLRADKESALSESDKATIRQRVSIAYDDAFEFSTTGSIGYSVDTREEAIFGLLDKLLGTSVVVTNRLHGVIFCLITGTPVIALPTNDHKLTAFWSWVEDIDNAILLEDVSADNIVVNIKSVRNRVSNVDFRSHFDRLFAEIVKLNA